MGTRAAVKSESASWWQRMTLGSEFELSIAGFGLMGEPGSVAERLQLAEFRPHLDTDVEANVEANVGVGEPSDLLRVTPLPCQQ